MNDLPIHEISDRLAAELSAVRRAIIRAPTGSGKSTQVPQMLVDRRMVSGQVIVLQPRRLAARLLAARVASERGADLGGEVGFQVRFQSAAGPRTRILYVTEGILARRLLSDPGLPGVGAVILDEFHERHLYGDLSLAMCLEVQAKARPDLLVLVMSATLPGSALERYLEPCLVLSSEGRQYPVSVRYLDRPADFKRTPVWEVAARELPGLLAEAPPGDALVFMPGAYEIQRTLQALRGSPAASGFRLFPLHGDLAPADQDRAVAAAGGQRIIVSTNVAETSLTIPGVTAVLDSGLARLARFDPYRGINTLVVERISRASADQRTGRAGRVRPGACLRLWTESEHESRPASETPEIRRVDLAETVLLLRAWGVADMAAFRWPDPPEPRALERAEQLVRDLGAVDAAGAVTELGRRMLRFPAHPRYARMLLAAQERECVPAAALVAALTQERDLLARRTDSEIQDGRDRHLGEVFESDFELLMRAFRYAMDCDFEVNACRRLGIQANVARQVRRVRDQFLDLARAQGWSLEDRGAPEALAKCLLAGMSDQLARRCDRGTLRCDLVHGRRGELARESVVRHSPLLVAAEVREIGQLNRQANVLLTLATAVREEWLRELFPDDFSTQETVLFDSEQEKVVVRQDRRFRDLVLESRLAGDPPLEEAARLLAEQVLAGKAVIRAWDERIEQWILRVNSLRAWRPDLGLPAIGLDERRRVLEQICLGAVRVKEIRDRAVWPALQALLTPAQAATLDKLAPERLGLPRGKTARLLYAEGAPPALSATIQDLFGVSDSLHVAGGRIAVVIHVLAPNRREVQVTQSLAGFWRDAYPRVKKELQRKYPKHEWR